MEKCKKKIIQADLDIFTHIPTQSNISRNNQAYTGIIQAYSEPCVAMVYSKIWYIQNPGISKTSIFRTHIQSSGIFKTRDMFRILGYSELEAYSEACQTSTMEHFEKQVAAIIIFASYNYFRNISISCPLVEEINIIFLMQI